MRAAGRPAGTPVDGAVPESHFYSPLVGGSQLRRSGTNLGDRALFATKAPCSFMEVLEDSKMILIGADVQADGPLPHEEKLKDAYSHIVENTAFFGDVALRFPKIVHYYFDQNSNWNNLIRWGISFCNQTGVFDGGPHTHLLNLMAQELGISEKSPDYKNPFQDKNDDFIDNDFRKAFRDEEKRRKKEDKRKELRKGPRITKTRSEL
ncbi:coiled-coil domain-containing protein 134-like isoform X3 [Narcine bancroftii]|uniref:coiled-coil domain-containing protein 134-like isoform X3 n=1 Tax=Narcine bancroftii TaxID=1343680 RepID=UPI003831EACA